MTKLQEGTAFVTNFERTWLRMECACGHVQRFSAEDDIKVVTQSGYPIIVCKKCHKGSLVRTILVEIPDTMDLSVFAARLPEYDTGLYTEGSDEANTVQK